MVDRLAHLYYLESTYSYEEFENWSFIKQYEANNKALSDSQFKHSLDKSFFVSDSAEKAKFKKLKKQNISWSRPDIEKVFKSQDLKVSLQIWI